MECAGFSNGTPCKDLSICLRSGRGAGFDGLNCTWVSRSERRNRPLGAQILARGAADTDGQSVDDAHVRHKRKFHLYEADRARHAGAGRNIDGLDVVVAATLRC